jgi:hypothetical protein
MFDTSAESIPDRLLGKTIVNRNKYDRVPFTVEQIQDEVSASDGEQKYFIQRVRLADNMSVEGDPTRYYSICVSDWLLYGENGWRVLSRFAIRPNHDGSRIAQPPRSSER